MPARSTIAKIPGACEAKMPREIEPMKGALIDAPFDREGWLFEDKYDGIRAIAYIQNGKLEILSRNQKPMTLRYPELKELPKWVKAKEAILDGEIIVLNESGNASFQDLQARFGVTNLDTIKRLSRTQKIVYIAFDLLYLDGFNLMGAKLLNRKALLQKVASVHTEFRVAPHVMKEGIKLYRAAERKRLEGIMAKNGSSCYEGRRSTEWLKIKTVMRQEAVIVGYTMPQGSREYFGALHLGLYQNGKLVSVGKVGTGFDTKQLKNIYDLMQPLKVKDPPFGFPALKRNKWEAIRGRNLSEVQWLKPKLVCEVKFTERTADGSFRHPSFVGLRFDKKAKDCTYEAPIHKTK
ncbi:MAG TPA: non-homologous end-joining DNA ligase [Candidatus Kapabacteria bacterium]